MTQQLPVTPGTAGPEGTAGAGPAVVEFGAPVPAAPRPGLSRLLNIPWSVPRPDTRVVPVLAGLGAIAVFASLIGEWQNSMVDSELLVGGDLRLGTQQISTGINEIGAFGTGYLLGVFAVVACTCLVLFGTPGVRRHARVAGLGATGTLLALLVATAAELDSSSAVFPIFFSPQQQPAPVVSYGRGLYMAFLGVAAFGAALYLADRLAPVASTSDASGEPAGPAPWTGPERAGPERAGVDAVRMGAGSDGRDHGSEGLWPWRRRQPARIDPAESTGPADLTVSPAAPFAQLPDRAPFGDRASGW